MRDTRTETDEARRPPASTPPASTRRGTVAAGAAALLAAVGRPRDAAAGAAPPTAGLPGRPAVPGQRAGDTAIAVLTGGLRGTYVRIADDLARALEGTGTRVLPVVTRGSGQNLDDLSDVRGIEAALVQTDAWLDRRRRLGPGGVRMIEYALKLYDEEFHVVVGPGVRTLADLAGKRVNVDQRGSGTTLTASSVFQTFGVPVESVHDDQTTALGKLLRGEIAALTYVTGKPVSLLSELDPAAAGRLRLLPVPLAPALLDAGYVPARIERDDYPALGMDADGVDTISVGTVLAVYVWPERTERRDNVARFVSAILDRLGTLQEPRQPPFHPKWRTVRLKAEVPTLKRFDPAQGLLQRG